jgi:hypothetical protein
VVAVKNEASSGRGILDRIGFKLKTRSEVPDEIYTIGIPGSKRDVYTYELSGTKVTVPPNPLTVLERV